MKTREKKGSSERFQLCDLKCLAAMSVSVILLDHTAALLSVCQHLSALKR